MYLNIYENKTDVNIRKDMIDKVTAPVSKIEGTLIYDALSPCANELAKMYIDLNVLYGKTFIENIFDEELDLKANEYGLTRKQPTKSTGEIKIIGKENTVVPIDYIVSTESDLQFKTTEPVLIDKKGYAIAKIESYEAGLEYNVLENIITKIVMFVDGITEINNLVETKGGSDTENDEDLKKRLIDRIKNPGTSGNIHHYKQWALEVEGCGDVKVIPLWNGSGTVKIIVVDTNKESASEEIINNIKASIEDLRPVGADVTVESAELLNVDISINLKLLGIGELETIKSEIKKAIDEYFKLSAFNTDYVSIAKIGAIILEVFGVADYNSLTLNGKLTDIQLENNQVAGVGEVTINVQA